MRSYILRPLLMGLPKGSLMFLQTVRHYINVDFLSHETKLEKLKIGMYHYWCGPTACAKEKGSQQ